MEPAIVAELGKHASYFEPFCGSMAVLLRKEPSKQETVNDLHGDLINLARVLADPHDVGIFYGRLQTTLFSEDLFRQAHEYLSKPIEDHTSRGRAFWYFVESWMGRNGLAGIDRGEKGCSLSVRWTSNGGSPTIRWQSAIASIPAWHERLKNVVILNRDAFSVLARIPDSDGMSVYVDPPYFSGSRTGFKGSGSSARYLHEFDHTSDHQRLRDAFSLFKQTRVVVSYYDCDEVRRLYDGWTFTKHYRNKNLHLQNKRGATATEAPEVLILNGASYAEGPKG